MRDIDYGIFPYTSSSSTISAYGPIGAGIPGQLCLDHVVGVLKAYSTCVGAGPFAAEKAMPETWHGNHYDSPEGNTVQLPGVHAVSVHLMPSPAAYGLKCQNADIIALTKLDVLCHHERDSCYYRIQIKRRIFK